jgi:tetratricopeptide (TPR) repeat protein
MDKIHFLLQSLSKPQHKMLKVYLQYFSVRKEPDTQLMKLVDILLSSETEVPGLDECSRLIYGKMNYNAIQKIKSRLLRKVENLLLLDSGTEKREIGQDELDRYVVLIRRKVALFHILLSKSGNSALLISEMEDIIRLSKKYEVYSTLIEQLKFKKWLRSIREGENVLSVLNKEIGFYVRCNDALNKATDCYYIAMIRSNFKSSADKRLFQRFLKESITTLTEECRITKSPIVSYYTKQLESMYHESMNEVEVTRDVCLALLRIVTSNKSVYRKQRVAIVYDHLASCEIRLGNFDLAVQHAIAAQKNFIRYSANYYTSLEYEFLARFYDQDTERSKILSSSLLKSAKNEMGDFRYAKYLFYQANVLYVQKKYKDANRLLNYKLQLSKDKQGWELSIRILKIQILVDLDRIDEASSQISSLLKHTERSFSKTELKPREKLIIKILRMLDREGFSSSRILSKINGFYENLLDYNSFPWEPISSELVPFEKWLSQRYKLDGA